MRKYSFLLVVILGVQGCVFEINSETKSDKKKPSQADGVKMDYYPGGQLRAEVVYKDGKKNGTAKQYYQDGKLYLEIDYANNIKHGWVRRYYEDGKIYMETPYDSGMISGVQKKYRVGGKLSAEIPYYKDFPCIGLKEYLLDGSLKGKWPTIVIKPINNLWKDNQYMLRLSMSDATRAVEYYLGELSEGKSLAWDAERVLTVDSKGVGTLTFTLPQGAFMMKDVNIIAKVKTLQGNYYITQRRYNLAIENKP